MKAIPYGRQQITEEDIAEVVNVLTSDFLTQGPAVDVFEKRFAEYIGCKYAVAVSNGTAALHLGALTLNTNEHSHVITTPITFVASANAIGYCGGTIHFADIDPVTFLLDLNKVETLLKSKPKGFFSGIVPVDFAGHPVNLEAFRSLADKHGLWIMEDACHAPGGYFTDAAGTKQSCGNGIAEISIFSFHPVKHIACGEGGMITTNDAQLYEKLLLLRTHGITKRPEVLSENHGGWYYEMQTLGYNYRLTDFQAALGTSQLVKAPKGIIRRRSIANKYQAAFSNKPYIKGQSRYVDGHAYHLYVILVKERKALYDYLRTRNIFCQIHYIPVHIMPYYKRLGWKWGDFPMAEDYYEQCLSLPMFPSLSDGEQDYVINCIYEFYASE